MVSGALAVLQRLFRATPFIVFALALQMIFALTAVLPPGGMSAVEGFHLRDRLAHLIGPMLCLALPFGAWASPIFYDFFRASGGAPRISARRIAEPVAITAASLGLPLVAASMFIESVFGWPGIGRAFLHGISYFDVGAIAGVLLVYCTGAVLTVLVAGLVPKSPRTTVSASQQFSALGKIALAVLIVAVAGAVGAGVIAPIGPYFIDQTHWQGYPLAPGFAGHLLGTEENGRDLLARILVAIRTSLFIATAAACIASAIAAVVARIPNVAQWFGSRDLTLMAIRSFAGLPFVLTLVVVVVARSHSKVAVLSPLVLALLIAVVSWPAIVPAFRRFTRATLAAVVGLTACALLIEATLSAIGCGVQPPTPSLGNLLANAQSTLVVAPWIPIFSSIAGVTMLFVLQALGDELREMDGGA